MRTMYDSVNPKAIPFNADIVAGYVDGRYKWTKREWSWFSNSVHVAISVDPNLDNGVVLDVERGDARNDQVVSWVRKRRLKNIDPTIYTSLSNWSAVRREFKKTGEREPHYWIAKWDNDATIMEGAIAHQYSAKRGYDLSMAVNYWPGVDPRPVVRKVVKSYTMYKVQRGDNLTKICHRFRVPIADIVAANNVKNPNLIYTGTVLRIPRR